MTDYLNIDIKYPIYRGPLYNCSFCQTMFISEAFLSKHQKKCLHKHIFTLLKEQLKLKKKTRTKVVNSRDLTKIEDTSDYFCNICFSQFFDIEEYNRHLNDCLSEHSQQLSKYCEQNEVDSTHGHWTNYHRNKEDNSVVVKNIFKCDICSKIFTKQTSLKVHMKRHTAERPFSCSICHSKFIFPGELKRHIVMHSGEKPYACSQCDKKFTRSAHLEKHLILHTGEKPFECPQCDKKFAQRSNLKKHLKVHIGVKPYACPQCPQRFTQKGNLKSHIAVHSGEKPFACTQCDKKFTRREHLKNHLLVHTGEKPFACSQCPSKFTLKGNLKKHSLIHLSEQLYSITSKLNKGEPY